jgi:uncharacterized protein YbjQ (UPF0145 family)
VTDSGPDAGLPQAARDRLVRIQGSGTWGSTLSADEFAAIRGAGFEPVGQVFGACVYNIGYVGASGCAGGWSSSDSGPAGALTRVSGQGGFGVRPMVQALYEARHEAIGRMTAECAALGGHGIVGVSLTVGEFPFGGQEFQAIGTAVRGAGAPAPPRPFTSDLSGQDFAKLIHAGWVPVGLALGISLGARHDDWQAARTTARGAPNAEVDGYTELIKMARHDARVELAADVARMGAEGVVVSAIDLRVHDRECSSQPYARDHLAEVTIIGTAIARFSSGAVVPARSLAILSLGPQSRQAARASATKPPAVRIDLQREAGSARSCAFDCLLSAVRDYLGWKIRWIGLLDGQINRFV